MITGALGMINGLPVYSSPHVPRFKMVQFRFPKTKKKRIQKKWRNQDKNYQQVPISSGYIFNGNTIVVHPDDLRIIERMIVKL